MISDCISSVEDPKTRDEYQRYLRLCQTNIETALANLSICMPARAEYIEALALGVRTLLDGGSFDKLLRTLTAVYVGSLCDRDVEAVVRSDIDLYGSPTMSDFGVPSSFINRSRK